MKNSFLLAAAASMVLFTSIHSAAQDDQQNSQTGRPDAQNGRPAGPPDYFSLGVAAGGSRTEFIDSEFIINPFPFVGFKQGRFYSQQAGVGYQLAANKNYRLSILAEVGVNEINRNQVDALDDLESLDLPIYAGLSLDVPVNNFVFTGTVQRELGFASEGWRAIASVSRPYNFNRKVTLVPSVSVQWSDDNVTDYIYGVSARDVTTGREFYEADDSFRATASLTGIFRLSNRFTLIGSSGVTMFDDEVYDSPIVDQRAVFSTFFALGYNF